VTVNQPSLLTADQLQPAGPETLVDVDPPPAGTDWLTGLIVAPHGTPA
jgi:hypothetical protein